MREQLFRLSTLFFLIGTFICTGCDDGVPEPTSNETGTFTDSRDSHTYNWVKIGNQTWMSENFAFKIDTGGCWAYNNDESNVAANGYLYNWWAAIAVAPSGWHLPTSDEWVELNAYLEDNGYSYDGNVSHDYIGKAMATDSGWNLSSVEGSVGNPDYVEFRNKSGFSAIPSGVINNAEEFSGMGEFTYYWSATAIGNTEGVFSRFIHYNMRFNQASTSVKSQALPARYIKDL